MKEANNIRCRVLLDYQTFHIQRFGGISRYFHEMASRMRRTECTISILLSMNQYLRSNPRVHFLYVPKRLFKALEGLFRAINRCGSLRRIKAGRFDVLHPTYYDPYFLDALGDKPFVLTVHDMTHERYPEYFAPNDKTALHKRLLAERAARIIAISTCTKRDIMHYLHVPEDKIDVIYHGFEPRAVADVPVPGLPPKYILYVGERRGYKNFGTFAAAVALLHKTCPDLHVVLTGRPASKSEQRLYEEQGIADCVHTFTDVDDNTLALLFRKAVAFVYPSLYEGFGIPILEAFAQDCPVVLSRASCFPEVAGDAALYFDTLSAESLAEAVEKVVGDANLRRRLVEKGRIRLKDFTWEKTAQQTEACYMKCLAEAQQAELRRKPQIHNDNS